MKMFITVGLKGDKAQVLSCTGDGTDALDAYKSASIGNDDGEGGDYDAVYLFKRPAFDKVKKRRKRRQLTSAAERLAIRAQNVEEANRRNQVDIDERKAAQEAQEAAAREAFNAADAKRRQHIADERANRTASDEATAVKKRGRPRKESAPKKEKLTKA